MDMRAFTKERGELAHTYAKDGAYRSAARVLRETADALAAHADRLDKSMETLKERRMEARRKAT